MTTLAADGTEQLALAKLDAIGDPTALYDSSRADIDHEQAGMLPAIWSQRVAHTQALRPAHQGRATMPRIGRRPRRRVSTPPPTGTRQPKGHNVTAGRLP